MPETLSKLYKKAVAPAPAFCKCSKTMIDRRLATKKVLLNTCRCGEDKGGFKWTWDQTNISDSHFSDVQFEGNVVTFHPHYSQGTAVVKGEKPLELGKHHYWEVKIMSFLTGTDLMIGIGTDKVDIHSQKYNFTSFLGMNNQSWGFSYRGLVQNDGKFKYYGKMYSRGCIVGVYLNLENGTLEYYLNRRPLGKAYTNIPMDQNVKLYPMICATSAQTSVKLINSTSVHASLQLHCLRTITRKPHLLEQISQIPGLKQLINDTWFLQSKEQYEFTEFEKNNLLLEDEAVVGSKKKKYIEETDSDESINGEEDIYKNIHRIKHFKTQPASSSSSDDSGTDDSSTDDLDEHFFCYHEV